MYKVYDDKNIKVFSSKIYNYVFNKNTGLFIRYGESNDDDPIFSPFGPEFLDIEITTKCDGVNGKLCVYCYKSNNMNGKNMSFETFREISKNFPDTVCQITFGVDSKCKQNPDTFKIFE